MTKITAAALKRALNAAGAERLKRPAASAPKAARYVALKENGRASERMIAEALRGGGLDLRKYKSIQVERSAELQRVVEEHKSQVLRETSRRRAALRSGVGEQGSHLRKLALGRGFFPHPAFRSASPLRVGGIPNTRIHS